MTRTPPDQKWDYPGKFSPRFRPDFAPLGSLWDQFGTPISLNLYLLRAKIGSRFRPKGIPNGCTGRNPGVTLTRFWPGFHPDRANSPRTDPKGIPKGRNRDVILARFSPALGTKKDQSPTHGGSIKKESVETLEVGGRGLKGAITRMKACLLYTSPSPRDKRQSRMPSSA